MPGSRSPCRGLSFPEVVVAVFVLGVCMAPLLWVLNSSRTDTAKAINYLRAVELANEAIEWATVAPFFLPGFTNSNVEQIQGSLVAVMGSKFEPASIDVVSSSNPDWTASNLLADKLSYSEQYNSAYFYRSVKVTDITAGITKGYLRKVTVTVEWSEGKTPANPDQPGQDRNKKIVLNTLILDDKKLVY